MSRLWPALLASTFALGCGSTPPEPSIEELEGVTAEQVLDRLVAAYRGAESYFDNAEYSESFVRQGEGVLVEPPAHQVSVVFERPNRFRIARRVPEVEGPGLDVEVVCNGKRLRATVSDLPEQVLDLPAHEALARARVAPDLQLRRALLPVPLENLYPQLDLLLATDEAPARLLADAEAELLTSMPLRDVPCYRVALRRPAGTFVLWVGQENALLHRMEVPTDQLREQLDPEGVMMQWRLWIDLHDATIGGVMADAVFAFPTPDGARMVKAFEPAKQSTQ